MLPHQPVGLLGMHPCAGHLGTLVRWAAGLGREWGRAASRSVSVLLCPQLSFTQIQPRNTHRAGIQTPLSVRSQAGNEGCLGKGPAEQGDRAGGLREPRRGRISQSQPTLGWDSCPLCGSGLTLACFTLAAFLSQFPLCYHSGERGRAAQCQVL